MKVQRFKRFKGSELGGKEAESSKRTSGPTSDVNEGTSDNPKPLNLQGENLMAFIEIQSLFKRFKDVVAVNRIQLEVDKGEMLTLAWAQRLR